MQSWERNMPGWCLRVMCAYGTETDIRIIQQRETRQTTEQLRVAWEPVLNRM